MARLHLLKVIGTAAIVLLLFLGSTTLAVEATGISIGVKAPEQHTARLTSAATVTAMHDTREHPAGAAAQRP